MHNSYAQKIVGLTERPICSHIPPSKLTAAAQRIDKGGLVNLRSGGNAAQVLSAATPWTRSTNALAGAICARQGGVL